MASSRVTPRFDASSVKAEMRAGGAMHGDALSSWTGSGKGILRPHQRRQRPRRSCNGPRVSRAPYRKPVATRGQNSPASEPRRNAWAQHRICLLADALLRNGALTGEQISAISVHSSLLSRALLELATPTGARDLPVRVSFGQKEYGQGLGDLAAGRAFIETHQARRPARCQPCVFFGVECVFFALVRLSKLLANSR